MIRALAPRLLGLGLFAFILSRIDLAQALAAAAGVTAAGIVLSLAAALVLALLRGIRWQALLSLAGVGMGRRHALEVTARSMLWGAITPARAGELVRVHDLVKQADLPLGRATGLWMVDMGLDVAGAAFATFALVLVDPGLLAGLVPRPLAAGMLAAGAAGMLLAPRIARWLARFPVFAAVADLPALPLCGLAALSVVSFAAYAGTVIALAAGFPPLQVAALSGLASLVNVLPVTVLGLGTRDATFIAVFARQGVPAEPAVALSLLTLAAALLGAAAYWALSAGLRRRK